MGTLFPKRDKIPNAKAISVAIGIPAPDCVLVPKFKSKNNPAGSSIPPSAPEIGSNAFLHRIINECTEDGFLLKPRSGYYEKNVVRKSQKVEAEASIEIEEPVQYKIIEEREKTPVRKLDVVEYNREDGNDVYKNEDWISLDNAQGHFGLNKKYLINLVNYSHLKTVGKTLIHGKWTCVVNFKELNDFCNYKEKVAAKDGHRKQCQSCNTEFNAWNDNVKICRSCMSGV